MFKTKHKNIEFMEKHIKNRFLPGCRTKGELAPRIYPGITFDYALPQPWVNHMYEKYNFDVRGVFVWGYVTNFNAPLPITPGALKRLRAIYRRNKQLDILDVDFKYFVDVLKKSE